MCLCPCAIQLVPILRIFIVYHMELMFVKKQNLDQPQFILDPITLKEFLAFRHNFAYNCIILIFCDFLVSSKLEKKHVDSVKVIMNRLLFSVEN